MSRNSSIVVLMALASSILAGAAGAQQAGNDPILGTWRLNVERSVYSPGPRPPVDFINVREYATLPGGWFRFTNGTVNQQGAPTFGIGVYKLDGQRHPVHDVTTLGPLMTTGRASNVTRSYRVIDPRTTESTTYTEGTAGIPIVRAVSPDGRTFIETTRGTNAQGVAINNVLVWDRVR